MSNREFRVGGNAIGSFSIGDNAEHGDVTVTQAADTDTSARDALLDQLAVLRAQVEPLDRPEALTRIDDLEEEIDADEPDRRSGIKALDRLKNALTGVASVAGLVAGIEEHVRSLFS